MTDLREQLTGAVSEVYRIGDELGGGGMSRVFVAEDLALGRTVVIKVLHPELAAGVNAERFNREVQLAARMQHPHIVPVITAGQVDGLPYYVMPFVKGEALATRVARGPMPFADVVNVMGDVAKALAFAHSEGVVHRDIKPDNILLSGGAATVADFGIAKAISSSRRSENDALTSVGTSLGTAGYMAPEQVAGDPSLDHRADIYALGCVAYEMLTGASPFAGKSGQQMLAAHVLEQPVPVLDKRPDTPPQLASLVMRCISKDPAERPQSGEELLAALDTLSLGGTGPQPTVKPAKRRAMIAALGAAVVAAAVAAFFLTNKRGAATNSGSATIAVAPFEVLDPTLALWREGLVDVLSRNLDGAASMHTVSPSAAIKRWEGRVGRDDALTFAKRTGAQLVVYGSIQPSGKDVVSAKVWLLDTRSGRDPVEMQVQDSSARMDRLSDSLSVKLVTALGGSASGAVRSLGSGSLPALKAFLQGTQFFRRTRFDSAAIAFRQATSIDTSFAIAHAYLNQTLGWTQGTEAERITEGTAAQRHLRGGLSPLDSLIIASVGHYWDTTGSIVANRRQAYLAAESATQRYPGDALAWYLYADFRFHTDPQLSDQEALSLFNRSIEADSNFAPSYIHAIELSYRYGPEIGTRYSQAYLARAARDRQEEGLRLAMNLAMANGTRDAKLKTYIDTASPLVVQQAWSALMRLPDADEAGLYLMRTASKRPDAPRAAGFQNLLIQATAMRGHIDEAWKASIASKNYAAAEIAALGLVPGNVSGPALGSWMQDRSDASFVAIVGLAMARDTTAMAKALPAVDKTVASMPTTVPARQRAGAQYFAKSLHAYYQLARGDTTAAAKEFDALSDTLFQLPVDQFIRARLIGRTDPKRALTLLREKKISGDLISVARELEIARLSEKTGDTPRAVDGYSYVANAWQNTENDQLKQAVKESRDALKRLDSDGRVRAQLTGTRGQ